MTEGFTDGKTQPNQILFQIPHRKWVIWLYYLLQLICGIIILGLCMLMFLSTTLLINPLINRLFIGGGATIVLATIYSLFQDTGKIRGDTGIGFTQDYLYLYRYLGKIKIPFTSIRQVQFFPALIKGKSPQTEGRAWVRVRSETRSYLLAVPRYQQVFLEFENRGISTRVNRKVLPLLMVTTIVLAVLRLTGVISLVAALLALFGFYSRNAFFSRRSELLVMFSTVGLLMLALSTQPWSKKDRLLARASGAKTPQQREEAAKVCREVTLTDDPRLQNNCAWFLITNEDIQWRNYHRGVDLASAALQQASGERLKAMVADTLACGEYSMGEKIQALQLVRDYHLKKREGQFMIDQPCKD